jgi:predicted nucleic acid-binding protein
MVYFDTNIYIYAFCKNVDNLQQKALSQKLLKEYASKQELIVSEIILYEFAFICHKLGESSDTIQKNLLFLSRYLVNIDTTVHQRVLQIFEDTAQYSSSFDVFHVAFSESKGCKLITFDKGFKKLQNIAQVQIELLR